MKDRLKNGSCPLCRAQGSVPFHSDPSRTYLRCPYCWLVFVPERHWLSVAAEKSTYDLHQNDPHDAGYRHFLSRLSAPLLDRLGPAKQGLDFGCGPGPALSLMLEAHGHSVDLYDLYYYRQDGVFSKRYDFICATEVVEHLRDPDGDFSALFRMLKKGGWLGIMTKLVRDPKAFSTWHYIRDRTHICFYCKATFEYIARRFDAELTLVAADAILLRKK